MIRISELNNKNLRDIYFIVIIIFNLNDIKILNIEY